MTAATTTPTEPATTPTGPWAVWMRTTGRRWTAVATSPTETGARALMLAMLGKGASGDWCVAPADDPPKRPKLW